MEPEEKIQARNLVKDYILYEKKRLFQRKTKRTVHAVRNITLEIPKGKIIGVLGINGAGKTTAIRMLASLITPTSGVLTMDGVDAVTNHLWVKERINVISGGERNLYWRLTARENLRYFGSLYGLSGKELNERISHLIGIVGLENAQDIPVERYSKGMKQRLQIARGLINGPQYIFLDEPTLGLDIMIAKEIRELISKLAKERGKGVLLTTHYISEAEELCDYIYVLDKGEVIAQGTKEELKELFMYQPELSVVISSEAPSQSMNGAYLDNNMAILNELREHFHDQIRIENGLERVLHISGTSKDWSDVLNILFEQQIQIQNLSIHEPNLEEILMKIISQSREEKYEKEHCRAGFCPGDTADRMRRAWSGRNESGSFAARPTTTRTAWSLTAWWF